MTEAHPLAITNVSFVIDNDAAEIGELYRQARISLVTSVERAMACGQRLAAKKASLPHGQWLPWLEANADVLGFSSRQTASRLMALAANGASRTILDEATAADISRQLWGNQTGRLVLQSISNEHYTPARYVDAARDVLDGIDLDPASCAQANRTVRAKKFFSIKDDGLSKPWAGTVWLNPPYGGLAGDFVAKFIDEVAAGRVTGGVILVNSNSCDSEWFQPLYDGLLCFTDHRISFYGDNERSSSPTHRSVLIYFGRKRGIYKSVQSVRLSPQERRGRAMTDLHAQRKQTRRASLIETLLNTAIGFGVALAANIIVLPWFFGITVPVSSNFLIALIFTVISMVRGFAVRRLFEMLRVHGVLP